MYQTIFLKENERDIFGALQKQGIKTKVFEHHFAQLFNRVYNNYVGYYLFRQEDIVYKLIVLPKTIEESDRAEKEFVDYLLHYYRINNLYHFDKEKKIPNSLLQLAFESNNNSVMGHNILDMFQFYRYEAILQAIEAFFKRHKNSKRIHVEYLSQSVKHKLNLTRNIRELDKTKIHQTQSKEVVFSLLATVTYYALKLFMLHKYNGLEQGTNDKLFQEVKKIQSSLLKKYKIEKGYNLSLATLQGIKIDKLFSKTEESRQLLVDIKSLFGFEQMYQDNTQPIAFRQDLTTTSLFINPNIFYEWYVYDILKRYAEENHKTIQFDKKEGTATGYFLNDEKRSSNPDYILTDESSKVKIVIDAKWKNVHKFGDIQASDYLKLQFDASLLERKDFSVRSYLIYPHIGITKSQFDMLLDEVSLFTFNILEIDMAFEKYGNNLEFNFDRKTLENDFTRTNQEEQYKSLSQELSAVLATKRTETITKLIAEEDNEVKEEIQSELDNQLAEAAFELSEQLEEQPLLPEIEEIVNHYEDVLEEESKKFLKSSSAIYSYYRDKNYEHFDYAMPGSGFWKLIELELNTSFVWHIRIASRVCNDSCPWTNLLKNQKLTQDVKDKGKKKSVVLNKCEADSATKLEGIMLGGIKLLSSDQNTFEQFFMQDPSLDQYAKAFIRNELSLLVDHVSKLRNEHAHIRAMSLDKFKELWHLLFYNDGNLKKLLAFKKQINQDKEQN